MSRFAAILLLMIPLHVVARPVVVVDLNGTSVTVTQQNGATTDINAAISRTADGLTRLTISTAHAGEVDVHKLPAGSYFHKFTSSTGTVTESPNLVVASNQLVTANMPAAGTLELAEEAVITRIEDWERY